uniref:Vitamin K epoxide reductase family protein n=1 Tax=Acidobacterium capsulatum TaxID=33075 RepID=A0A7V4XRZ6_9BACT
MDCAGPCGCRGHDCRAVEEVRMSFPQQVIYEYVTEEATISGRCSGGERRGSAGERRSVPQWLMIASCVAAIGTLVPVALYQSGVIEHLPEPPGGRFDSDRLTMAKGSRPLGIPDSYLGLASYGTTLGLLLSPSRSPAMNVARHAKLGLDAAMAATKVAGQVRKGRYCSWCLGTAAATAAMMWFGYRAGKLRREER